MIVLDTAAARLYGEAMGHRKALGRPIGRRKRHFYNRTRR